MKDIHFFDLDGTLVNVHNYIWLIDKEQPNKPIIKIGSLEFSLIKYNFYKKDNLKIDYDDLQFYISKEMFEIVKSKRKNITIDRLGLSFREWKDREYINTSEITFLFRNIKHLVNNVENKLAFLTARPDRYKHGNFLNKLRFILNKIGLSIFKIYFVGDKYEIYHKEYLAYRKTIILLEHLIGIQIENNKFISKQQDKFDNVYFYDDAQINIDSANDIQEIFNKIYSNSDDNLKKMIDKRLDENPKLHTNLISSNELNNFKTEIIELSSPTKYPTYLRENFKYIKNFKSFDSDK